MRLNDLKPAEGSKKAPRRLGRGIGSGLGKTGGRGHKGQHSRTGHFKIGFEGGQMPMQRRLPKVGFTTQKSLVSAELPLSALNKVEGQEVTLESLKAAGLFAVMFFMSRLCSRDPSVRPWSSKALRRQKVLSRPSLPLVVGWSNTCRER